jgi:hypothetical protein
MVGGWGVGGGVGRWRGMMWHSLGLFFHPFPSFFPIYVMQRRLSASISQLLQAQQDSSNLDASSLKMETGTALEYSTKVIQEGDRRCKKSTLNDWLYLTHWEYF